MRICKNICGFLICGLCVFRVTDLVKLLQEGRVWDGGMVWKCMEWREGMGGYGMEGGYSRYLEQGGRVVGDGLPRGLGRGATGVHHLQVQGGAAELLQS